jgi:hypothetical protein
MAAFTALHQNGTNPGFKKTHPFRVVHLRRAQAGHSEGGVNRKQNSKSQSAIQVENHNGGGWTISWRPEGAESAPTGERFRRYLSRLDCFLQSLAATLLCSVQGGQRRGICRGEEPDSFIDPSSPAPRATFSSTSAFSKARRSSPALRTSKFRGPAHGPASALLNPAHLGTFRPKPRASGETPGHPRPGQAPLENVHTPRQSHSPFSRGSAHPAPRQPTD